MTNCIYHPDVIAETLCDRCGKPICEKDKRQFLIPKNTDNKQGSIRYKVFWYCPLCNKKATKSYRQETFGFLILIPVLIVVLKLFHIKPNDLIITACFCLAVFILLYIIAGRKKAEAKKDVENFLKGLSWKTRGDEDIPVNRLLDLSVEEMQERGRSIYNEIKKHSPEEQKIHYYFRKKSWTYHDLGRVLLQFKKDIAYWSWRNDLNEKNINRTALVFAYLMAVNHLGKIQVDEILRHAPPEMIAPGLMKQLIQ